MSKIAIENLSYYYTDYFYPIFDHINLTLDTDWKTGLIGRNGRGKTTLLKLLTGELKPSHGSVNYSGTISCFPYPSDTKYTRTIDVIKENIGGLRTMEQTMEQIIQANDTAQMNEYYQLSDHYQRLHGYEMDYRIEKEMARMQMNPVLLEQDFSKLSGGEKNCMMILSLFLRQDGFVLLDEPTNHLDIQHKTILTEYLKQKKGFLAVSHDTVFLDQIIDHILSINKSDITLEQGNYSSWKENMHRKEEYDFRTRTHLEQEIDQLTRLSDRNRTWSDIGNKQKYHFKSKARTNGTRAYMRQAKHAEQQVQNNLEKKKTLLLNMEEEKNLSLMQTTLDSTLIEVQDLSFSFPNQNRYLFRHFDFHITAGERIWIKGKNGAGKSTFLKLLTGELPSQNIWYAENLMLEYTSQEPHWKSGDLHELFQTLEEDEDELELRFDRFMTICNSFDLPEHFENRPLETLSSGELKKVDIARGLSGRNHLLLLDEPLNYMDTMFRSQLLNAILQQDITVIFIEHDSFFGEKAATRIITLDETGQP